MTAVPELSKTPEKQCLTGRCAYDTDCTCEYYSDWAKQRPARQTRTFLRHPGRFFIHGHRAGRQDTCRRLWPHLDIEGRRLATVIAAEGDDLD